VSTTTGELIVRNGGLIFAEYSAENGDPPADGVDDPHCSGQAVSGHGRGMCQWGTHRWAARENRDHWWMVQHYSPGATIVSPGNGLPGIDYDASIQHIDSNVKVRSGDTI